MRGQDRLTAELLDAVVTAAHRGVPAYRAAQAHGIAKSTFYDWLRWGKEGREPYVTLIARLAQATDGASETVPAVPVHRPFVGRDREMAQLQAGVDTVCGGRGQLFLIVGEPGIGKTRLTEELAAHARGRMRVLIGRCCEGEGAPPFWPWIQIVRTYIREREAPALLAEMGAWAPGIAQIVPELYEHLPELPPAPRLDPAQARFRVFDGMTSFLTAAARQQPLLLVLDDLHWADRPSLLLLEFLTRMLPDARLLVVGAYRDREVRPAHPLLPALAELVREPVCERIVLRGLTPPDVARFIELHAGRKRSDALAETVYEKSEGNPFFITELVRLLADDDAQQRAGDATRPHFTIPQGVQAVIARRLNRLSEECNRILILAAAFGREFALAPLVDVSDASTQRTLDVLDEAVRAGIVAEVPGQVDRYLFSHALVRESLYAELGAIRRTRLHRRIAEVLVDTYAAELAPRYDELAHHFFQAALGGEGVEEAIEYAVRAAEYALSRLAYEQAAEHYEQALRGVALATPDEARRCRLLLALGDAFARASNVERAKAAFLQAAAIARQRSDAEMFAAAALGFGGTVVGVGTVDQTLVSLLEESLVRLPDGDSRLRAMVLASLATQLYFAPDAERRTRLSWEAVDMARRIDDPTALIAALEACHFSAWGSGDPPEQLALATEIVRLAEELNDRERLLIGHHFRITNLLELGDIAAVDAAIVAYEALADEVRQPAYAWRVKTFRAMRALMAGRFSEVEALAAEALALGQRVQRQTAANFFAVQLFSLRREQGRLAELEDSVRAFVDAYPAVPSWRSALASVYAVLGRDGDARAQLERLAVDDFGTLPPDNSRLMGLTLLAEVCAALGDHARSATLYDLLLPQAGRNVVAGTAAACNGAVARPLGLLAATLGRWDDAGTHFEAALRMHREMGAPPFVARTQLEYAAMLLARATAQSAGAQETVARARQLLDAARQTASALGMTGVEAHARRLLADTAVPTARPHAPAAAANTFRRDGDLWTLAFAGEVCRLKDVRGMRYIAALLRRPNVELHVLDLVHEPAGASAAAAARRAPDGQTARGSDAGSALDAASRRAYRQQLAHLRQEVQDLDGDRQSERMTALQREIEFLARELARGVGLGGRDRPIASDSERARIGVTRAIRLALATLRARHPALAQHLTESLRTGTYCRYGPASGADIEWHVEADGR